MKHTKRILAALLCAILVLCPFAYAHSGGTDANGGHHDYKNKSGLGPYHYHHGMGPHLHPNGVCPYAVTSSGSSSSSSNTSSSSKQSSSGSSSGKKIVNKTQSVNPNKRTITYPGISFTIDGEYFKPINANAEEVEAFVYAGTTYLPVRGIAYALGLDVLWVKKGDRIELTSGGVAKYNTGKNTGESRTETVIMPTVSRTIYLDGKRVSLTDEDGKAVHVFTLDGTTYVPVRAIANALGLSVTWNSYTKTIHLKTGE